MPRTVTRTALALAAIAATVSGCASRPATMTPASPGTREVRAGIELAWWVVDEFPADTDAAKADGPMPGFSQVMSGYEKRPTPVAWRTLEAWRGCGLRVVAVPTAEVDSLRRRLNIVGPTQQQWLGEVPRWTEAARSPSLDAPTLVQMDNGPLQLDPGTVRLLLRAWAAPGPMPEGPPADGARTSTVLQLEIVPQVVPRPTPGVLGLSLHARPQREREGVVFSRLTLEASLAGDESLLILPERPEAEWSGESESAAATDSTGVFAGAPRFGPPEPPLRTLGDLLMGELSIARGRKPRMILVLTPSVPGEYRLTLVAR